MQQRRTFADVSSGSENAHFDKSVRQQTAQSSSRSSKYASQSGSFSLQLSHNTYINVTCRSRYLAKLFLSSMRRLFATRAPESPPSSWRHLLTRTRLHDLRLIAHMCTHSGHHVSDTCTDLQRTFHVGTCRPAFTPGPRVRNQSSPSRTRRLPDL